MAKRYEDMTLEEREELRKRVAKREADKAKGRKRRKRREKKRRKLEVETDASFVSGGLPGLGKRR